MGDTTWYVGFEGLCCPVISCSDVACVLACRSGPGDAKERLLGGV